MTSFRVGLSTSKRIGLKKTKALLNAFWSQRSGMPGNRERRLLESGSNMRSDTALEPKDVDTLAYIHSNKFITTKLFHRKFHPPQCYTTACVHLRGLVSRGLLLKTQKLPNDDTYFYLSRPAIQQLSGLARILTSPEIRSPHINPFEREHDKRVLTMRVQIEREGGPRRPHLAIRLRDALWTSDGLEKGLGRGPGLGPRRGKATPGSPPNPGRLLRGHH